jgi:hypothetical protein
MSRCQRSVHGAAAGAHRAREIAARGEPDTALRCAERRCGWSRCDARHLCGRVGARMRRSVPARVRAVSAAGAEVRASVGVSHRQPRRPLRVGLGAHRGGPLRHPTHEGRPQAPGGEDQRARGVRGGAGSSPALGRSDRALLPLRIVEALRHGICLLRSAGCAARREHGALRTGAPRELPLGGARSRGDAARHGPGRPEAARTARSDRVSAAPGS